MQVVRSKKIIILPVIIGIIGIIVILARVPFSNVDEEDIALQIHDNVNGIRTSRGLPALAWDPQLAEIAFANSKDMADRNFFDHVNPDGLDVDDRAFAVGYYCQNGEIGENLSTGYILGMNEKGIARTISNGLYDSEEHRINLLDSSFDKEGIAAFVEGNYIYVTQELC